MPDSRLANRVMYDGLYTFVLRVLNIGCAAGLGILTARILGPAGKGLYTLPAIEAGLVASCFSGLNSGTSYFLLNRQPGRNVLRPALATAGVFLVAGTVAIVPIALLSGQRWTILPAILSLPSVAAINIAMGYAIGVKRVRYSTTLQVAATTLTLALVAAGFFLYAQTVQVAIVAWIAGNAAVAAIALAFVASHSSTLPREDRVSLREYLKFAFKIGGVNLVALLNYRADLYIVALLASPAVLGTYTVAVSAAESLLVPTQVAALVTSPYIGGLDVGGAARLAARCVRNNLLIALVVCGSLFVVAAPLIQFLYGRAFMPAVPAFDVLLAGVVALSLGSPISNFFTLKLGRPEVAFWLASLSAAICIGLSVALIPRFGIVGAATGSTAGYVLAHAVAVWYFGRIAGLRAREILLPTLEDVATYGRFLLGVLRDGYRYIRPGALGPSAHR